VIGTAPTSSETTSIPSVVSVPPAAGNNGPVTVTAGSSAATVGVSSAATRMVSSVSFSWVMVGFLGTSVITGVLMIWL
jgi:hypothetical protein